MLHKPRGTAPHSSFDEGAPFEADGVPAIHASVASFLDPRAPDLVAYPLMPEKSKNTDSRPTRVHASVAVNCVVNKTDCFRVRAVTVQARPLAPGFKASNAHGAKCVVQYGRTSAVACGLGAPAVVAHPICLASRTVYGNPLELAVNYAMLCPLVHLPPDARKRCYAIRDRLLPGSAWETDRERLLTARAPPRARAFCEAHAIVIQFPNMIDFFFENAQEFKRASGLGSLLATARVADPETGLRARARVAYGAVHMSVLKHFPSAKLQMRGTGSSETYLGCKEPHRGRTLGGAPKTGDMENAALMATGAAHAHHLLAGVGSDAVPRLVCDNCGTLVGNFGACRACAARGAAGTARFTMLSAEFERLLHLERTMGLDIKLQIEPIPQPPRAAAPQQQQQHAPAGARRDAGGV